MCQVQAMEQQLQQASPLKYHYTIAYLFYKISALYIKVISYSTN
jgi:hypothetical protein